MLHYFSPFWKYWGKIGNVQAIYIYQDKYDSAQKKVLFNTALEFPLNRYR
jgi:hypothetical protein